MKTRRFTLCLLLVLFGLFGVTWPALAHKPSDAYLTLTVLDQRITGQWDLALRDRIARFEPDWIISAGFMRILGSAVLSAFPMRVVNTHPALLPSFPGAHAVRDALAHGVRVSGTTIHLVDDGVDTGPIVAQRAVSVEPDDDEATLHERIKVVERALLVEVVGKLAHSTMLISGRRVYFT